MDPGRIEGKSGMNPRNGRSHVLQSSFLRKIAQLEEEDNYAQIPVDLVPGRSVATYKPDNSLGKQASIREKISRFILRPKARRASESDGIRQVLSGKQKTGYEYTRWTFVKSGSVERSVSHEYLEAKSPKVQVTCSGNHEKHMTKSASARTVRFRCPYDSSGSSSDQESTLVSPYVTSSFRYPPLGEHSISSGYSSDFEPPRTPDHWATTEDEIDGLLCQGQPPVVPVTSSLLVPYKVDDIEVDKLDLSIFDDSAEQNPYNNGTYCNGFSLADDRHHIHQHRKPPDVHSHDVNFNRKVFQYASPTHLGNGSYASHSSSSSTITPQCHLVDSFTKLSCQARHQHCRSASADRSGHPTYDSVADEIDKIVHDVVKIKSERSLTRNNNRNSRQGPLHRAITSSSSSQLYRETCTPHSSSSDHLSSTSNSKYQKGQLSAKSLTKFEQLQECRQRTSSDYSLPMEMAIFSK